MFKWLKRKLRGWLAEDDPWLDCVVFSKGKNQPVRFLVTGAVGLLLSGKMTGPQGESVRLVGEGDVVDRKKFWRLWRRFTKGSDVRWEDGAKFDPERDR